jgi:hypothetical protein
VINVKLELSPSRLVLQFVPTVLQVLLP